MLKQVENVPGVVQWFEDEWGQIHGSGIFQRVSIQTQHLLLLQDFKQFIVNITEYYFLKFQTGPYQVI